MKSSANVFSSDFFSKCVPADLVTFTKEILDGRLHFLCGVGKFFQQNMLSSLSETIIISCDDSKTLCSSYGRQSISSQRIFTATVFQSELLWKKKPFKNYRHLSGHKFIEIFLNFWYFCLTLMKIPKDIKQAMGNFLELSAEQPLQKWTDFRR